jgi:competence protein ComEC
MANVEGDVYFLDVAQGHATVAATEGVALLIDCPASGAVAVNALIDDLTIEHFAVVITHRDLDHCAGIRDVLRHRRADRLFINAAWALAKSGTDGMKVRTVLLGILGQADLDGTALGGMVRGDTGMAGALRWAVLSPPYDWVIQAALKDTTNRSSIVLRLELDSSRFLIMGDADGVAVDLVLSVPDDLTADVVLLPHHGATLRNLAELLQAASPTAVIVSAGRSAGIHPTLPTLEVVRAAPCRLLCTQANAHCHAGELAEPQCAGTIHCTVGPAGIEISPDPEQHAARFGTFAQPRCV